MRKHDRLVFGYLLFLGSLALGSFASRPAYAAAGDLDTTFGKNGVTVTSVSGTDGIVNSIELQSDGKILVYVGGTAVLRYMPNGVLDPSFGSHGVAVLTSPIGGTLVLQPDGKIVIGGVVTPSTGGAELGAVRLNSDGSQDTSFGSDGLAVVSLGNRAPNVGNAVLVDPTSHPSSGSGDILVCTTLISTGRRQPYQTALARFTSDGHLDTNFGNQGLSIQTGVNGCTALAVLFTGEILVINSRAIAQFTANGSVEPVTGGPIAASTRSSSFFTQSIFDANGNYLLGTEVFTGQESRGHNAAAQVLRFTETGSPDPSFANMTFHYTGTGGSGIEALVDGLAVQSNGDIVVVGSQITFTQSGVVTVNGLARLTPTGSLDTTFGKNGTGTVVNNLPGSRGVVIQSDGKFVTAGFASNNTDLTLARYLGK
jgi:uncharacterized delta-60 repeat protein